MNKNVIKNILAAIGVLFICIIALIVILSYALSGKGIVMSDKVAVVKIEGVITDSFEVSDKLREYGERDDVKAVIIRIESPGGAVGPSQELYSGIKRLAKKKRVVASMGAIAASGGYYAAVAADKIVANPGTITGSIGVLVEFINASELLAKIGLHGYVVKSGKFKDAGSPFRKMEPDETEYMQLVINDVNSQFVKAVADGRKLKVEDVEKIADGRVFTGAQAMEKGLIDQLGDLDDAIDLGARLAGMKGKPDVIYPDKKGPGILKLVFGESAQTALADIFSGLRVMYLASGPVGK